MLMRQCWKAILNMLKLNGFDFWIMPSQGKTSTWNIARREVRDVIPMHFRLFCRHIDATIHLCTWEACHEPNDNEYKIAWWTFRAANSRVQSLLRSAFLLPLHELTVVSMFCSGNLWHEDSACLNCDFTIIFATVSNVICNPIICLAFPADSLPRKSNYQPLSSFVSWVRLGLLSLCFS